MDLENRPPKEGQPDSGEAGLKLVNRLSESRSPYVRGHMNNPVAWQIWSPETLELAKKHDRLIFVSIGYAACHCRDSYYSLEPLHLLNIYSGCHVMERESFENPEIAHIINSSFIPIKIDREERPDVDRIYMNYVQAVSGEGGWPLNVFLTPDLQPLFGGTYFPGPESSTSKSYGGIGFKEILHKMQETWKMERQRCLDEAKQITEQLQQFVLEGLISKQGLDPNDETKAEPDVDVDLLEDAYDHFLGTFDPNYGGFGTAPKFPTPAKLRFLLQLLQYPQEVGDVVGWDECKMAKSIALKTLDAMKNGGIHDLIGGGFHRYSVTLDWTLPHFEKM
jgi:uncharacterized protein YyaL (SSP411 family)